MTAFFTSCKPEVGEVNADYSGGDSIAVADVTGNGYEEILVASAATVEMTIECVLPVAINIKPGESPNSIER